MSSSRDPRRFIGYPYVCIYAFSPNQQGGNQIHLPIHTEGEVENVSPDGRWALVTCPRIAPDLRGWVPLWNISVGQTRKFGDIRIDDGHISSGEIANKSSVAAPDLTASAILWQLRNLFHHSEELPITWIDEFAGSSTRAYNTAEAIHTGIESANMLEVFNDPQFRWRDICAAGRGPHKLREDSNWEPWSMQENRACIYVIFYWDFPDDPSKVLVYIGKTKNFGVRMDQHKQDAATGGTASSHYRMRRKARQGRAVPICFLPPHELYLRSLAEQIFVNLLQTWHFYFTSTEGQSVANTPAALPEDGEGHDPSRHITDRYEAKLMKNISEKAAVESGWPGGVFRPSFDVQTGLNWTSPIGEALANEKTVWTKQVNPLGYTEYRRTPYKFHWKQSVYTYISLEEPVVGTMVSVVFEIAPDGQKHHTPWARLPMVGPWEDWSMANQLGIKIQFEDSKGKWQELYLQCGSPIRDASTDRTIGAITGYSWALAWIRFFRQIKVTNLPAWASDMGVARLKEVTFDHMSQTIRVRDVDATQSIQHAKAKSYHSIFEELKGYATPKTLLVDHAYPFGKAISTRRAVTSCDACKRWITTVQGLPDNDTACKQAAGEHRCEACRLFNRPCGWTPATMAPNAHRYLSALKPLNLKGIDAMLEIGDPQLTVITHSED